MVLDIELKIVSGGTGRDRQQSCYDIWYQYRARIIIGCEQLFPLMEPWLPPPP